MANVLKMCECGEPTANPNGQCAMCATDHVMFVPADDAMPEKARGAPRGKRESDIEKYLVARAKAAGGEVRKVSWIGRAGAPDRLVMLPEREGVARDVRGELQITPGLPPATIWVELKAPGRLATFPRGAHEEAQHREHERMRKMGQRVVVIDSKEGVDALFK